MKIQDLTMKNGKILIKEIEKKKENKTESGIFLPENDKVERVSVVEGEILNVSDGVEVETGQNVVISRYGGMEIEIEKEKYLIINEEDILAIF